MKSKFSFFYVLLFSFIIAMLIAMIYSYNTTKEQGKQYRVLGYFDSLRLINLKMEKTLTNKIYIQNYDNIVSLSKKFDKILLSLDRDFSSFNLGKKYKNKFFDIKKKSKIFRENIEQYKSVSGLLHNSLLYIFELNILLREKIKEDREKENTVNKVTESIAFLNFDEAEAVKNLEILNTKIYKWKNRSLEEILYYKHIEIIISKYKEFLLLNEKIKNSDIENDLQYLYHTSLEYFKKQKKVSDTLSNILYILGIVLLIIILIIYTKEQKTKKELESILEAFDRNVIFSKTDLKGIITHVSSAFCNISGYKQEELLKKAHNIVRHSDMPKEAFKIMWETIKSGKTWRGEVKNLKKDGGFYWVDATISPDYNTKGNIIGYSAVRHNITAKKELEDLSLNMEEIIKSQTKSLHVQKEEVETVNRQMRDSIEYAALIQSALIPDNTLFRKYFRDYFVIWHPKDLVGGDIYLFEELSEDECLLMVIDCTGHGVFGAFVTMLVKAIERQIVATIKHSNEVVDTAKILSIFNSSMKHLLKQDTHNVSIANAGFDGQIMYFNKKENIIKIASARNEIFYYQDDVLHSIKGDRHSIGYRDSDTSYQFTQHIIDSSKDTTIYLLSDGYVDQLGGEKKLPFGKKRLKNLLKTVHKEKMADQQEEFLYTFYEYKADLNSNDDVSVIGIKI